MPRAASNSDSEESTRRASKLLSKADAIENGAESGDEEEGDGSEYEIEKVLDAKRGYFPDGRMGYYVSWKGYGPEENSWVDELDAGNAHDLVEEFWKRNPQKKRNAGRKSMEKKSPTKSRNSAAADDSSNAGETKSKKRGRKSASQKVESGDDVEVDQPVSRATKKARKNATHSSKALKARAETPEEEEKTIGSMSRFMHMKDWEALVSSVDTIERNDDNSLVVYFTLNTGESVKEDSQTCNQRFPQKLLDFYASNLRWRSATDDS